MACEQRGKEREEDPVRLHVLQTLRLLSEVYTIYRDKHVNRESPKAIELKLYLFITYLR